MSGTATLSSALVRASTADPIAELPVAAEQPVFLSETGTVVLAFRTGALRTGFGGVSYALRHAGSGVPVPGRPVLMSEFVFPAGRTEFVVELPTAEPSALPSGLRLVE